MDKNEIRRVAKRSVLELSMAEKESQSQRVVKRLRDVIVARGARVVALFAPLGDEVQITPLIEMLSHSSRVVLPRVEGDGCMEFYDYSSETLQSGSFGIMEPQVGKACRVDEIDLMVVPGLAFTAQGQRLGRGKGYYDRYLAREGFRAYTIGVCYASQMQDVLPCESYDRRVDEVVCE